MPLRIYDTLAREKREFVPVTPGRVGMYVCGMTVQDKPHVGHIRASLSGEVMRRYLEHIGYEVSYVYNFTDVDDKIIERAGREGVEYLAVSERNIEAYLRFAALHNILPATHYPRATRHIAEILDLIRRLVEGGYAYAAGGDVYFDVSRKADSGNLFFIEDIAARADPEVVRYYLLSTHYRSPIDFSEERLAEAAVAHQRLRSMLERAGAWEPGGDERPGGEIGERIAEAETRFA